MDLLEKASEKLTFWIGTPLSIIIHTLVFVGIFVLALFGYDLDEILLILTTAVSLEAIYLAIFIQMTVNRTTHHIAGVKEDIEDIQEDVEDIQEDVEDIGENVDDLQEDIDSLETNVKEISDDYAEDESEETDLIKSLTDIENRLITLQKDIANLKIKK